MNLEESKLNMISANQIVPKVVEIKPALTELNPHLLTTRELNLGEKSLFAIKKSDNELTEIFSQEEIHTSLNDLEVSIAGNGKTTQEQSAFSMEEHSSESEEIENSDEIKSDDDIEMVDKETEENINEETVNIGQPVQILSYDKQIKSHVLHFESLNMILMSDDVKDCDIAVISIAGPFRKGKSFMLSFFLRYLHAEYDLNNSENWLERNDGKLAGFAWRGGSDRETTGIWIWSRIFTKILPNGEKIGIMLMDTQGTFDSQSTMKDNATVFSLSTMLSSIQIYNLFHNIQEDDLQHLQLFTEYGKLALTDTSQKAFQRLLFLIRDWSYEYEASFGFNGGRSILKKKLQVSDDQDEELSDLRKHLKACYDDIDCFLMPHPGKIATSSVKFKGQLKYLDKDFKRILNDFVPMLLSPENILIKKINGENITAKNLLNFFQSYWNIFKSGKIPSAQSILNATAEANMMAAKIEAHEYYQKEMQKHTATGTLYVGLNQMERLHDLVCKVALDIFTAKAIIGNEKTKIIHLNKLKSELQGQLLLYVSLDKSKKVNELENTISDQQSKINKIQAEKANELYWQEYYNKESSKLKAQKEAAESRARDLEYEKDRMQRRIDDSVRALQSRY